MEVPTRHEQVAKRTSTGTRCAPTLFRALNIQPSKIKENEIPDLIKTSLFSTMEPMSTLTESQFKAILSRLPQINEHESSYLCHLVRKTGKRNNQRKGAKSVRPVPNPTSVPVHILEEIFLNCDFETLMNTCAYFEGFLNERFWRRKCFRDNITVPSLAWFALPKPLSSEDQEIGVPVKKAKKENDEHIEPVVYQFDYKRLYVYNPLNRNLVPPMNADTTLEELNRSYPFQHCYE